MIMIGRSKNIRKVSAGGRRYQRAFEGISLNIFRLSILIASLIASAFHSPAIAATTEANSKGWLLKQKHCANGEQRVYILPQHLRVENVHLGTTVIADAQTGKVWLFSDERKISCCVNWDKFEHSFSKIMQIGGESLPQLKWNRAKDSKGPVIAGFPTTKYVTSDEKMYFGGGGGGFLSGGGRKVMVDCTIYATNNITTSPKILKVLSEMQTTPVLSGVPLQEISFYRDRKKTKTYLNTLSATQITDDKKFWAIPKYKQVATPNQVTSVTDGGLLEDMVSKWKM